MEKIKNIIFDFGGVLIDWNPVYLFKNVFKTEDEMNYFLENICRYDWNILQDEGRSLSLGTSILQQKFPAYSKEIAHYDRWEEMLEGLLMKMSN